MHWVPIEIFFFSPDVKFYYLKSAASLNFKNLTNLLSRIHQAEESDNLGLVLNLDEEFQALILCTSTSTKISIKIYFHSLKNYFKQDKKFFIQNQKTQNVINIARPFFMI